MASAAFSLLTLAREVNGRVIATNLNHERLGAVSGKVLSLTATLEENQEALAGLGATELAPVMDGLRAILDHSDRLSKKMQKQGWAKRMFNATEIEHAIQALEREIDTEMNTVNLVCNFVNHGNVHRMHHDLQSLRAEMMEQFSQLLAANQDTQQSIAEIEISPVAQPNAPQAQVNEPLQNTHPPLTTWTSAPDSLGLHGSLPPAPARPTIARGASAPLNGVDPTPRAPIRAQTQRRAPPSTIDSDDEFDFEAELARSKASAAATVPAALPSSRLPPSMEVHPPRTYPRHPQLELANDSDLDSDLDSEGDEMWSERPVATRRYRPSAISAALTLPPPPPSNPRAHSPLPPSSALFGAPTSPHPPTSFIAPQPPRLPSPDRRISPPRAPVRPSTPPRVFNNYDSHLHQSPERLDLPNLAELSISPPRPPPLPPQPPFTLNSTQSRSQSSATVIDVLQAEPDDQEEPLPAFTEFDPLVLEEEEVEQQRQQDAERSRAGTSALAGLRVDSPARRTPVVVDGDYKPDEFDPSMLARPGQPEEVCRMCANLLPMSEYPSSRTTEACTHPINICRDCIRGYLHEEVIEHGRALQVRCPIPMCGEYLSCDEFKRLADHFVYTAYCDIIDGRRLPCFRPSQPSRELKPCPREQRGYLDRPPATQQMY